MKTKLTVFFLFLFSSMNAQILNAGFEEWDTVRLQPLVIQPKFWHTGYDRYGRRTEMDSTFLEGNYSIKLEGGIGPGDSPVLGLMQQQMEIPSGLDSISFYAMSTYFRPQDIYPDFFKYGFHTDTLTPTKRYADSSFILIKFTKDTSSNYKRYSFDVPDSLWGEKLYLTFICQPIAWLTTRPVLIDAIEFHGDFTVPTKNIDNQLFTLFPNPSSDLIFLENLPSETSHLDIFSIEGKQVWSGEVTNEIDVSDLKSDCYFLIGKDEFGEQLFNSAFIKN